MTKEIKDLGEILSRSNLKNQELKSIRGGDNKGHGYCCASDADCTGTSYPNCCWSVSGSVWGSCVFLVGSQTCCAKPPNNPMYVQWCGKANYGTSCNACGYSC